MIVFFEGRSRRRRRRRVDGGGNGGGGGRGGGGGGSGDGGSSDVDFVFRSFLVKRREIWGNYCFAAYSAMPLSTTDTNDVRRSFLQ